MFRCRVAGLAIVTLSFLCPACVTHIEPASAQNPAPDEAFAVFDRIELMPLAAASDSVAEQASAMDKIQTSINEKLARRIDEWNANTARENPRTLVIEPVVTELKFVSGGKRFLAGSMAGSSAVILRARFVDKASGAEVAHPEFFSRANAMGGSASMGGTDNAMLERVGNQLAVYVIANYRTPKGGPVEPTNVDANTLSP